MVIYLKHQKHGTKVAISDMEADADCKNGWERYNVGTLLTPIDAAPKNYCNSLELLRDLWEGKFGKKPHHKKSLETLRKELDDGDDSR